MEMCGPIPDKTANFTDDTLFTQSYLCDELPNETAPDSCTVVTPLFEEEPQAALQTMLAGRGKLEERKLRIKQFIEENAVEKDGEYLLCQDAIDKWVLTKHPFRVVIQERLEKGNRDALEFYGGERRRSIEALVADTLAASGRLKQREVKAALGTAAPAPVLTGPVDLQDEIPPWLKSEFIGIELSVIMLLIGSNARRRIEGEWPYLLKNYGTYLRHPIANWPRTLHLFTKSWGMLIVTLGFSAFIIGLDRLYPGREGFLVPGVGQINDWVIRKFHKTFRG